MQATEADGVVWVTPAAFSLGQPSQDFETAGLIPVAQIQVKCMGRTTH